MNKLIEKIRRLDPSWLFLIATAAFAVIYFTAGIVMYLAFWRFV